MNANKQDAGGEVTNPDNVGGLPELPKGDVAFREDCLSKWQYAHSDEQMRAYGELCRAAPAGGDAEVVRLRQLLAASQEQVRILSDMVERGQAHHERMMKLMDSAPAGSGEVEQMAKRLDDAREIEEETSGLEDTIDAMRTAAALLRKLQQGAE